MGNITSICCGVNNTNTPQDPFEDFKPTKHQVNFQIQTPSEETKREDDVTETRLKGEVSN